MEAYLANFFFEKNANTKGIHYLVIYAVSDKGPLGPVYIRKPEFRYISKAVYGLDEAKKIIGAAAQESNCAFDSNIACDTNYSSGRYRIHLTGEAGLSGFLDANYKNKFEKVSLTEYFRTFFNGQKLLDFSNIENLLLGQKELNTRLRAFFTEYVMPIRFFDRDYAITQKDALLWLGLAEKNKQNLIKKVIRNKKKEKDLLEIAEKSEKLEDEELSKKIASVVEKPNLAERLFRIMRTPDKLIARDVPATDELNDKCKELDAMIKKIHEENYASIFLEDMCVRLFFCRGLEL